MEYNAIDSEAIMGYKMKTPFYELFSIYDQANVDSVKGGYSILFNFYKDDYEILTELAMIINWKIWEHHGKNAELERIYDILWSNIDAYAMANLKGRKLKYYLKMTS